VLQRRDMSDRDLSPFFAPKSIGIVGAGEQATSSGGAVMQMLRQAGYGGRVVPVNPKGGTIFGYESVTSIATIDPPVDLAVIVIRPDAILDAGGKRPTAACPSWSTPHR
jgi:acyl-CoA synthetase (NDP forming)